MSGNSHQRRKKRRANLEQDVVDACNRLNSGCRCANDPPTICRVCSNKAWSHWDHWAKQKFRWKVTISGFKGVLEQSLAGTTVVTDKNNVVRAEVVKE